MNEVEVLKDQIESLQAANVAKDAIFSIRIANLKIEVLNAYLLCGCVEDFKEIIDKL